MEDDSDIYIVDTRNAEHRPDHHRRPQHPWAHSARPVRTLYAQRYPQTQPQMLYAPPPSAMASNIFGKVTAGQLVDLVAQIFAALMPLPGAPVATDNTSTDVGNLILYQSALASYAKRDEQVRTLGNLVTKLIG